MVTLAVGAVAKDTSAADGAEPRRVDAYSFFVELRAIGGGAEVEWSNSGSPVVDQHAAAFGLGLRGGWLLGSRVHLGATASVARYSLVGQLTVRDTEKFTDPFWLRETSYTVWAPLGVFFEFYPMKDEGLCFGLAGSWGWLPANADPPPGTQDAGLIMAGYAVEAGYELDRRRPQGPGIFLRYAGWAGRQSPFYTDFPDEVDSREITLGLRWTLRVPND
jgi:hypothetical protein